MITKQKRVEILGNIENKEKRIFVASILDKLFNNEKNDRIEYTNFLDLNELNIAISILNSLKAEYTVYTPNESTQKKNIFFIPTYISTDNTFFSQYISCIKIIPKQKGKLLHKDYMGSIYSLGIKREMIGDIFAYDSFAYVFCMKSVESYFNLNLTKVANQNVLTQIMDISSAEIKELKLNLVSSEIIIPSFRADVILSEVYKLSRNNIKEKIKAGDLYVNAKEEYFPSNLLEPGDIISFKKCGKFKLDEILRNTKSGNIVLKIQKYET